MKLIKKLGLKLISNRNRMVGLFYCSYCKSEVEKELSMGNKGLSCGCLARKMRHGISSHPIYSTWLGIRGRCINKTNSDYKNYGAKGSKVCEAWLKDPKKFVDWALRNGWVKGMNICRNGDKGNYEPSNCSVKTTTENQREKSSVKLDMDKAREIRGLYENGSHLQKELSVMFNVSKETISSLIRNKIWREYE